MSRNKILFLLCGMAIAFALPFYFFKNPPFSLQNIIWEASLPVDWSKVNSPTPERLLHQPFTLLGEGHQTYAFVGADGQTVLKFVKFGYMNSMSPTERDARLKRLFNGYLIGFQKDRENTGLISLHQAESHGQPLYVMLEGQFINVTPLYYILQRKVTPLKEALNQNTSAAKTTLDKILDLYADEYKRGIYDSDHNVLYNTGFIEGKPVRLDIGRLKTLTADNCNTFIKLDLEKIMTRFRKWIVKSLPEKEQAALLKHLQERIDQIASRGI